MTQDEMIELAKKAGWQYAHGESGFEPLWDFAKLIVAKEQDRCCSIVFAQCESDNVAQRTVDAIRGKA
jgi:hypothetical protein